MDKLQHLLTKIKGFIDLDEQRQVEKAKRGELFNVFSVLGLTTNETRTHSAFLAELLNPQGSHGLGNRFLKLFIEQTCSEFDFDTSNAKVEIELSIGNKNEDCSKGGRIDIIITSKDKAIIIENKIYAGDQEKQLVRYNNYGKEKYPDNFKLLYLTLDGHNASDESRGKLKEGETYNCISYRDDILRWLEESVAVAYAYPLVRETIVQYINLVKYLTNQFMDNETKNRIIAEVAKEEYIEAAWGISDNMPAIKNGIIREHFIQNLKSRLGEIEDFEKMNLENKLKKIEYKKVPDTLYSDYAFAGVEIEVKGWDNFFIRLEFEGKHCQDLIYGILTKRDRNPDREIIKRIEERKLLKEGNSLWPCFQRFENNTCRYWNAKTFKMMFDINSDLYNEIVRVVKYLIRETDDIKGM